jgi:predicted nucleic-acid-binding protein
LKIIADTNVLLRAILPDDGQRGAALAELVAADSVAVSVHALCELVWVLSRRYGSSRSDIAEAIKRIVDTGNVSVDRQAVSAGMTMLEAGGDFANGVIAYEGRSLGGDTFVSFDRKAVRLVQASGHAARLLA